MMNFKRATLSTLATLGLALALAACGKPEPTPLNVTNIPNPQQGGVCPYGQVSVNGVNCEYQTGQSFDQMCWMRGGNIRTANGTRVCRTMTRVSWGYYSPNMYYGSLMAYSGQDVQPGDKLVVRGARGGWASDVRLRDRILKFWKVCPRGYEVNVNGRDRSGNIRTDGGVHQGLVGTDGGDLFEIGSDKDYVFTHGGAFYLGFNVPPGAGIDCAQLSWSTAYIVRCRAENGTAYPCN